MASCLNHFNLLQIISFVYVLLIITLRCSASSLSHYEECSALFQFKQSIIHQDDAACIARGFQKFDSWKPTSNNASNGGLNCCSWEGVVCSNDHDNSRVIGLDLSESFLCGHINSNNTLFSLVHLQRLNLAMNDFDESEIPSEIASLKQLRSLNLSSSGFTGIIPSEISQLIHLSSLDLSWNPLTLQSPSSFKNLVRNLTGLEELHLSGVDISSSVPRFLANFSSLRSIRLKKCLLENEFPAAILKLPKLKILDLASNTNLTGYFPEFHNKSLLEYVNLGDTSFFGILPESISNLNRLTLLRLSRCSFSGRIPGSLSNLTQLTGLGLGDNKFTGPVPSLENLLKLNILKLNANRFEEGRLPNWLGKLTELNELYASDMNINGEIPPFLANLTRLSLVRLGNNSLIGHIPPLLFNLTQLGVLDLRKNKLQGPILNLFSNLRSLEVLHLSSNNFSGSVGLDIFLGLNKLESLWLGDNEISLASTNNYTNNTLPHLHTLSLRSCNLKEFPAFLRFQNQLAALQLGHNQIKGLIPVWIWNNSQETLQAIDLSHNSITGFHQHPRYLPWRNLEGIDFGSNQITHLPVPPQTTLVYDISDNNLTGEIPPLICEAKSLQLLDLSSNNLSGTLPPCLGNLSSLVVLDISRNNFSGTIMNTFMHGSSLENIDLSENGFKGQVPRSMANCTNLEVLSLGDNSFDDIFPFWLEALPELQVLILRSNRFHGQIQKSTHVFTQFPKLRILDISNNGFSGQLHQNYFKSWNAMKSVYDGKSSVMESDMAFYAFKVSSAYSMTIVHKGVRTKYQYILNIFTAIDISCNHFEGEIPLSLQDLRGLESLNLSNNHFTGQVLPSLGYLNNLESLDLSRNELYGEIPQQLVQLGFLAVFNVSFNNLSGRIPQGKQFSTFENISYEGNPRLCGRPLSKECGDSKAASLPPTSDTSESWFPSERIDWIFVFSGVVSGLAVGIVIGNFLHTNYSDRFRKRKDTWVRPLGYRRRNEGSDLAPTSSSKGKEIKGL